MVQYKVENPAQESLDNCKTYTKPEVIHDLDLETRAGSPLGFPANSLDPTGLSDYFESE